MTSTIIILAVTCMILLITQVMQAKKIYELTQLLKASDERLNAQSEAVKELVNWCTDQDASIHNILDTILGIDQEAQNLANNLIKTDNEVADIRRYYVTYVAREKEGHR